jgi:DNA-directed RNA polymerase specialized sigma24 family protein
MRANTIADALAQPDTVFDERMEELFLLALLLTGSIERAEACFVRAIDLAAAHPAVSDAYISSVARRCIIKAALELIAEEVRVCAEMEFRHENDGMETGILRLGETVEDSYAFMVRSLLGLNSLRRGALVLRILEKLHRKDIALLLGVSMSVAEIASKRGLIEYLQRNGAIRDLPLVEAMRMHSAR